MSFLKGSFLFLLVLTIEGPMPAIAAASDDGSVRDTVIPSAAERLRPHLPLLEKLFTEYAEKNHIPGLSFALVADGNILFSGSHGYTDLKKKIPVTTASVFRIASMTKSFTAMAILTLRDQGKLRLDDPAARYIPELRQLKYPTRDSDSITIRHLLTHGAGFPEDNPWGDRQLADSDREFMEFLKGQPSFSTAPGTAYEYSNLGFALLGKIITKVSGKPYQQYIREIIWKPLGMSSATWEYAAVPAARLAHGYRWQEGEWLEEDLLHDPPDGSWGAMGSMLSSVDEFAAYMALHLKAWPPSDEKEAGPLKRSSIREMHHPWRISGFNPGYMYPSGRSCGQVTAYGYGLRWSMNCEGQTTIAHTGGLPGFGSNWQILPQFGIGVVSMANRTYAPMAALNQQVLDTLIRLAGLKPRPVTVTPILARRKAELMGLLPDWKDAEKSGIFAENFFPDYTIEALRRQSISLFEKVGKPLRTGEIQAENNLRGKFTVFCEKGELEIYFTLSPENPPLIQEYRIRQLK